MKSILFLLAFSQALSAAPDGAWNAWQWIAPVGVERAEMIRLELPPSVLNASRPDLGDLRVVSPSGAETPCLLMDSPAASAEVREGQGFRTYLADDMTLIEISPASAGEMDAIELVTPAREFLKAVKVEGMDSGMWQTLANNEVIFRQPGGAQRLRIPTPSGTWERIRITVDDERSQPVPFTGVRVSVATHEPETRELPVTVEKREELPGETRLTLDLGAGNLDVEECILDATDAVFSRSCELAVAMPSPEGGTQVRSLSNGTIYRVEDGRGMTAEQLAIPMGRRVPGRFLLITIRNEDSPPLTISGARLRYHPTELAFHAVSAGQWQLRTGNRAAEAPDYDLALLRTALADAGGEKLTPGPLRENPDYQPPPVLPGVETSGAPIKLNAWSRKRELTSPSSGVIRIDLDAGVLAACRSDLGDIRLVRDGRQIPYLVSDRPVIRDLMPTGIRMANDPGRPTLSRWEISLPVAGLPAVNLCARSVAGPFERDFTVSAGRKDSKGNDWSENLGAAKWTKSGEADTPLLLNLRGSRLPSTIFLETDNGDNPPISLEDIAIRYSAPSITAKLAGGAPVFLHYGNPRASPPRYDLRLVWDELMAADQQVATLGPEENLHPEDPEPPAMDAGSPWLWAALAGVVAVLLVIVAKLLPRDATPTA